MARDLLPQGDLGRLSSRDAALDAADQARRDAFNSNDDAALLAFSAGIERENYSSSWINNKIRQDLAGFTADQFTADPNYRFEDDEANRNYDPHIMIDAKSAEEAEYIRTMIDKERAQLDVIAMNGWGTAGQVFGGVFQPHVAAALPIAGKSVFAAMVIEAGLEAGSEVALHNMQYTRTMEESYWNVGLTAMGVGILGGAAKGIDNMRGMSRDVIDDINSGFVPGGQPDSVGAARVLEDDITAEDDRLIGGRFVDKLSIGQMAAISTSLSDTARRVAARLADNPLFTRGNAEGKTRGVSVESLHEAAMGRVVISTDKAAAMQKQSGMARADFEREVGVAMSNGDRHANQKVMEAAQMYRAEVIEPIQEAAGRLGLLETDEGLRVKIEMVEEDVQRLIDDGAGPGTKARARELEAEKAKIITGFERQTKALQAKVDKLQARVDEARAPTEEGGKARSAPKRLMTQYDAARSKLSEHQKQIEKATASQRAELGNITARNKQLKKYRKTLKDLKARQESGGNLYAESYFPRVYNSQAIYTNWNSLKRMLTDHFKKSKGMDNLEPGEMEEIVLETMQNMVSGRGQTVRADGKPAALRARALTLLDNQLEPFLEKEATQIMLKHAQGMQPYILMREAFGGQSLNDMIEEIRADYGRLQEAKNPETGEKVNYSAKEREKMNKKMEDDITRLRVIHDRLMHQVQRSAQPPGTAERVMQFAKLWNLATLLGGVVFSSLPDLARPLTHYGMRSFAKGIGKGVAQAFSGKGSISSIQVKRTGAAVQRTLNDRAMQLADSIEPESKWLLRGQKFWSKATGFDWYTDIMESIAAHSAMDYVARMAQKVARTQLSDGANPLDALSKADRKQISRMGLTGEDMIGIYNESMGTRGMQDTTLKYMNTMAWKDVDLAKRAEAAIGSDVRRTIIRIGAGEKPARMDEHMYSLMFQFQSFAMSAQNKILLAGMQNMNARTATGIAAMTFMGAFVGAGKSWLRGDDPSEWSYEQWVTEGIDRSGLIGTLREPFNALRFYAATQGWTDGVPSRYAGKGWERALTSPTASLVGSVGVGLQAAVEGDFEKAGDKLMNATPFINNTWHIRQVLTQLGES